MTYYRTKKYLTYSYVSKKEKLNLPYMFMLYKGKCQGIINEPSWYSDYMEYLYILNYDFLYYDIL